MQFLSTYAALATLVVAPIASAFTFTGPDSSAPLNLSGPIEITWDASNTPYSAVDLSFHGVTTSGSSFGYTLVQNLSVADGQYVWFTSEVANALQSTMAKLSADSVFDFEAMLHNNGSVAGATVPSPMYKVADYPYIGAAPLVKPSIAALFSSLILIAIWSS